VGFLFWLVVLHWLRYPHPAVILGWVALSVYLGCYLPIFVGLGRLGVHGARIPPLVVIPALWTALEYARAHLLTGLTLASLAHTQYRFPVFLQISDVAGQYGLGFIMAAFALCVAESLRPGISAKRRWGHLSAAILFICIVMAYGFWSFRWPLSESRPVRVLLVQGSVDVVFPPPPDTAERMHQEYWALSLEGIRRHPDLDLIIWPESVYGEFLVDGSADALPPPAWGKSREEFHRALTEAIHASREHLYTSAALLGAPLIVGINRQEWTTEGAKIYNSAVLVIPASQRETASAASGHPIVPESAAEGPRLPQSGANILPADTAERRSKAAGTLQVYDKLHLVMFGEYVPYARYFRGIFELTPLSTLQVNTEPGQQPRCFRLGELAIVPNICFESTVPHLIRRQLRVLSRHGCCPNILVNLTNDGWFRGSAALDLHLACSVFRAVEFRKPQLVAANTGISAWIDSFGRIRAEGPRRRTALILATPQPDDRRTIYLLWGDWLGNGCLVVVAGIVLLAGFLKRQKQRGSPQGRRDPGKGPDDSWREHHHGARGWR
jgi:apolipoprotein N-acyltransferase